MLMRISCMYCTSHIHFCNTCTAVQYALTCPYFNEVHDVVYTSIHSLCDLCQECKRIWMKKCDININIFWGLRQGSISPTVYTSCPIMQYPAFMWPLFSRYFYLRHFLFLYPFLFLPVQRSFRSWSLSLYILDFYGLCLFFISTFAEFILHFIVVRSVYGYRISVNCLSYCAMTLFPLYHSLSILDLRNYWCFLFILTSVQIIFDLAMVWRIYADPTTVILLSSVMQIRLNRVHVSQSLSPPEIYATIISLSHYLRAHYSASFSSLSSSCQIRSSLFGS